MSPSYSHRGNGQEFYNGDNVFTNLFGPLAIDRNGDGLITVEDFIIGARQLGWGKLGEDVVKSAFRLYDKNHNGYLDNEDIEYAYSHLNRLYY